MLGVTSVTDITPWCVVESIDGKWSGRSAESSLDIQFRLKNSGNLTFDNQDKIQLKDPNDLSGTHNITGFITNIERLYGSDDPFQVRIKSTNEYPDTTRMVLTITSIYQYLNNRYFREQLNIPGYLFNTSETVRDRLVRYFNILNAEEEYFGRPAIIESDGGTYPHIGGTYVYPALLEFQCQSQGYFDGGALISRGGGVDLRIDDNFRPWTVDALNYQIGAIEITDAPKAQRLTLTPITPGATIVGCRNIHLSDTSINLKTMARVIYKMGSDETVAWEKAHPGETPPVRTLDVYPTQNFDDPTNEPTDWGYQKYGPWVLRVPQPNVTEPDLALSLGRQSLRYISRVQCKGTVRIDYRSDVRPGTLIYNHLTGWRDSDEYDPADASHRDYVCRGGFVTDLAMIFEGDGKTYPTWLDITYNPNPFQPIEVPAVTLPTPIIDPGHGPVEKPIVPYTPKAWGTKPTWIIPIWTVPGDNGFITVGYQYPYYLKYHNPDRSWSFVNLTGGIQQGMNSTAHVRTDLMPNVPNIIHQVLSSYPDSTRYNTGGGAMKLLLRALNEHWDSGKTILRAELRLVNHMVQHQIEYLGAVRDYDPHTTDYDVVEFGVLADEYGGYFDETNDTTDTLYQRSGGIKDGTPKTADTVIYPGSNSHQLIVPLSIPNCKTVLALDNQISMGWWVGQTKLRNPVDRGVNGNALVPYPASVEIDPTGPWLSNGNQFGGNSGDPYQWDPTHPTVVAPGVTMGGNHYVPVFDPTSATEAYGSYLIVMIDDGTPLDIWTLIDWTSIVDWRNGDTTIKVPNFNSGSLRMKINGVEYSSGWYFPNGWKNDIMSGQGYVVVDVEAWFPLPRGLQRTISTSGLLDGDEIMVSYSPYTGE